MSQETLQIYACQDHHSKGRLVQEAPHMLRTLYQRDRDRIIHSTAFRRLQYKTQVFVYHEGDHFRTRLTHSIEVAQIARTLSRALAVNEDLAEALSLAHDLGHTPFGHAGEDALNEVMQPFGGFQHNVQTFRILTKLEKKYATFDGLNLTWEMLEGIVKHNGPIDHHSNPALDKYNLKQDLWLHSWPGIEAQIAALADDIAYDHHDIDDGIRARLFTLDDLAQLPLVGPVLREVRMTYPKLDESRTVHEVIRRMINHMVHDLIRETRKKLEQLQPQAPDDVRQAGYPVVTFSEKTAADNKILKQYLYDHMYRHYRVNRMTNKARRVIKDLFHLFMEDPLCLPNEWRLLAKDSEKEKRARIVADYIAGMTDRFALDEHARLFDAGIRT